MTPGKCENTSNTFVFWGKLIDNQRARDCLLAGTRISSEICMIGDESVYVGVNIGVCV